MKFINKISLDKTTTLSTRIETKIPLEVAKQEYYELLIDALKDQYDSDDDNNSIYTCSECGHTNKLIYDKVVYPLKKPY